MSGEGFRLRYINVWPPLVKSLFFRKPLHEMQTVMSSSAKNIQNGKIGPFWSHLAYVATLELTCAVVLTFLQLQ